MPNKIITRKNGVDTVILDVSGTTATEEKVLKGEVFTKADGTQATGTLEQTEGYQMSLSDDETEINFVWGGAKKEISFTVNGTEYKALEGMTWGDWVESDYNTVSAELYGTQINFSGFLVSGVTSSDVIENGATYLLVAGGGND